MATIKKYSGRTLPWRAFIHRKGHTPISKGFLYEEDAKRWANEQERSITLTGLPLTADDYRKVLVKDIVQRYLDEITPTKGSQESETIVLTRFKNDFAKDKTLLSFTKQDAYAYRDSRLKTIFRGKKITARTVQREINSIRNVFSIARKEWGYSNLINPFSELDLKGGKYRRKRRLQDGEMERLENACSHLHEQNKWYVPLAIYLAVETGMRLDEIFNLEWRDIDIDNRRIDIVKSKTDHVSESSGRLIVMTVNAYAILILQYFSDKPKPTDKVFPMSKDAFEQSFDHVLDRAKIQPDRRGERLQFRDLRREAGSRFDEAGLTKSENELMLGHEGQDTNSIYISSQLKRIQDKLDRYDLDGKTFAEFIAERKNNSTPQKQAERMSKLIQNLEDLKAKQKALKRMAMVRV
jgi:integrase